MPPSERPLPDSREAGTELVKPLDALVGTGSFVMSTGGQRQSRGQLCGVIRISVLHDFLVCRSPPTGQEVTQPDHGCPAAPVEPCVPDLAHSGCTRFSVVRSGPHAEPERCERCDCGVLGPAAHRHRSVTAAPWAARTNCQRRARSLGGPPTSAVNIPSANHACRDR